MRLEPEVLQRLGRFETEQPAADHRADLRACGGRADHLEVLDRAVDEAVAPLASRHLRHERRGAGRENQLVVGHGPVACGMYDFLDRVDGKYWIVKAKGHAGFFKQALVREIQVGGRLAGEKARQLHAVVSRTRLLAEHRDLMLCATRHQLLEKALADHAVADDDDAGHAAFALCSDIARAWFTTAPMTMMAGPAKPMPEICASDVITCRWLPRVPFSMMQAGVAGSMPAAFSALAMFARFLSPM